MVATKTTAPNPNKTAKTIKTNKHSIAPQKLS